MTFKMKGAPYGKKSPAKQISAITEIAKEQKEPAERIVDTRRVRKKEKALQKPIYDYPIEGEKLRSGRKGLPRDITEQIDNYEPTPDEILHKEYLEHLDFIDNATEKEKREHWEKLKKENPERFKGLSYGESRMYW